MIAGKRNAGGLRAPRLSSRPWPSRRTATLLRVERLESRTLMAAPVAATDLPNETLVNALGLGHLSSGTEVVEQGSLGNGPAGAADVEWYSFTLDRPAQITMELGRLEQ